MKILGISCFYHDAAACLVINSNVIAAAEEERFTRIKHDSSFPQQSIDFCLKEAKTKSSDLDFVVFYEKPFLKLERLFFSIFQTYPLSFDYFHKTVATWFTEKLWIKAKIGEHLGIEEKKILFLPHHLSHAASCFLPSGFAKAAILTNDGVGEWTTSTYGVGNDKEIRILKEMRYPHSLGLLYATITAFLGFEVNEGEYKVMGLSAFGKANFLQEIRKLFRLFKDGSIELDLSYFAFPYSTNQMYSQKLIDLLGEPRKPNTPFFTMQKNKKFADIAASIQVVTEEIILKQAAFVFSQTRLQNLCMAGGVALNGVTNARILRETGFKNLFIQPAAGDSGGALGAALYIDNLFNQRKNFFRMTNYYLGPAFNKKEIINCLDKNSLKYKIYTRAKLINKIVDDLEKGKVIGWFQGKLEWGPRALGNRSILADPRRKEIKDLINTKIKFREPFRPFAPVVIAPKASLYFDLFDIKNSQPARSMTIVCDVKKEKQKEIPAVTHVDGTARLQIIDRNINPLYYDLIKKFGDKTGTYYTKVISKLVLLKV